MSFTDEELIAQFAALSSNGDDSPNLIDIPETAVKAWNWKNCLIFKVMSSRVVFEATFSTALRKVSPIHPETIIQGLGNNYFIVEFKRQEEMLRVLAKNTWMCIKDMVVSRLAVGPTDLVDPQIYEFECWVEVHGVPPESLDHTGLELVMKGIGSPLTEIKSFWYDGRKVYKRKVLVNLKKALKPKLPMRHPQLGVKWVYVVYDNVANVCMFCAMIGHEHSACPHKLRLKQMQQEEQHKEKLGSKPIPETIGWKWLTDRSFIPREDEYETNSAPGTDFNTTVREKGSTTAATRVVEERGFKRPIDLNQTHGRLLIGDGSHSVSTGDEEVEHLNCKRAKETNPNSPSRFAS
ncbi:hypothetical protein LUZ62_055352 [Rhynchospora pubera]|uniref:CCHC-type domain-containing protein n=1 Tax=Rhynchospora pubera TaxID=906938 RepID=A0AAV8DPF6_9POAL|nr:hypothetical protein LUZ62_055352 [Rhynchospora pubera]